MEPLRKYDQLGREVVTVFSPGEKVYKSYWGQTKKIKVRYHIFHKDVIFDVYDFNGHVVMTNDGGKVEIKLKNFSIQNKAVQFKVQKNILDEWSKLLS